MLIVHLPAFFGQKREHPSSMPGKQGPLCWGEFTSWNQGLVCNGLWGSGSGRTLLLRGPTASALPGSWLDMQNLRPHSKENKKPHLADPQGIYMHIEVWEVQLDHSAPLLPAFLPCLRIFPPLYVTWLLPSKPPQPKSQLLPEAASDLIPACQRECGARRVQPKAQPTSLLLGTGDEKQSIQGNWEF